MRLSIRFYRPLPSTTQPYLHFGGTGRIRTYEARRHQFYRLLALAACILFHIYIIGGGGQESNLLSHKTGWSNSHTFPIAYTSIKTCWCKVLDSNQRVGYLIYSQVHSASLPTLHFGVSNRIRTCVSFEAGLQSATFSRSVILTLLVEQVGFEPTKPGGISFTDCSL